MDKRYLHTLTAGAWLPVVQSGLSGVIVFVVVLVIGLAGRWRDPLTWAGVIGVTTWGLAWLSLWRHWFHLTIDADRSGLIGQLDSNSSLLSQKHEIRVVVSEIRANGHLTGGQYLDLPCDAAQLVQLVRGLLEQNLPFSERSFCGAGKPFSLGGFRELRNVLQDRGLIAPTSSKSLQQGFCLTLAGKHILTGILEELTNG